MRSMNLTALDVEVLRFAVRWQQVRPHHVVAWTGAAPSTISETLSKLARADLLRHRAQSCDLRDAAGRIVGTTASVWEVTPLGARLAGSWVVPGTKGAVVGLPGRRSSDLLANHVLGAADLACRYRVWGFQVASEREIRSLEQATGWATGRSLISAWSVKVPGRPGIHPPDMGAVHPDGSRWAIELERDTKTVGDYAQVVRAYREARLGQVWHVLHDNTARRLKKACEQAGVVWAINAPPGILTSDDGRVRLQGWLPERTGIVGPAEFGKAVKRLKVRPPAGFALDPASQPDLSS